MHNSYHVEPAEALDPSFRYTHQSLDVQLSEQGVRQFELDLHLRPDDFWALRGARGGDPFGLEGRLLFVDADRSTDPYAALFKINNAQSDSEEVQTLVAAGFIVTGNVDGVTQEDAANPARSAASLEAGVHYSSSDFPAPVSSRDYWFDIPEGEPAQCNPVFESDPCTPKDIENLP